MNGRYPFPSGPAAPTGPQNPDEQMMYYAKMAGESCPFKGVLSAGMGFAIGGAFGLFMSSMRYDTPMGAGGAPATNAAGVALTSLPVREQLRAGLKDMYQTARSSARNFGTIGGVYAFTECAIEGLRARNDLWNGVYAGGLTGAFLARRSGPTAVALGALGFAAFSGAIDWYMRGPEAERKYPVM